MPTIHLGPPLVAALCHTSPMGSRRALATTVGVLIAAAAAGLAGFVIYYRGDDSYAAALSERQRAWSQERPTRWSRPAADSSAPAPGNAAKAQGVAYARLADGLEETFAHLGRLESPVDRMISSGELDEASRTLVADRELEIEELLNTTRHGWSWDPLIHMLPETRLASVRVLALSAIAAESGGQCFDVVAATMRVLADGLAGHEPFEEEARAAGVILFAGLTCADRASAEELRVGLDKLVAAASQMPLTGDRIESLLHARGDVFDEAVGPSALSLLFRNDWATFERRRELLDTWNHLLVEARYWRSHRRAGMPALMDRAALTQRQWRGSTLPLLQGMRLLEAVALDAVIAAMFRVLVVATDAARLLEEEGRLDVAPPAAADPRWSDPFSRDSSPLLFLSQEAQGHTLIYSVGPNRRDDHGSGDDFAAPIAPR